MADPQSKWKDDNRHNAASAAAAAILNLGKAILHLGIGWPLAALSDPLEGQQSASRLK